MLLNFQTALCNLQAAYEQEVGDLQSKIQALQKQLDSIATDEDAPPGPLALCTARARAPALDAPCPAPADAKAPERQPVHAAACFDACIERDGGEHWPGAPDTSCPAPAPSRAVEDVVVATCSDAARIDPNSANFQQRGSANFQQRDSANFEQRDMAASTMTPAISGAKSDRTHSSPRQLGNAASTGIESSFSGAKSGHLGSNPSTGTDSVSCSGAKSDKSGVTHLCSDRGSATTRNVFPALYVQQRQAALRDVEILSGEVYTETLKTVVESTRFEALSMVVIFLNTIAMLVQVQYDGYGFAYSLDVEGYNMTKEKAWPNAEAVLEVAERVFILFFTLELALRLAAYRIKFFHWPYHWLDFLIVVAGLVDWIAANWFDPTMLRMLRFIRLARILRTFSSPRFLDALYFLTTSIRASMSTLFWSLAVLTTIQSIAALTISQMLAHWFEDEPGSPESREVFKYYGTFTKCMLTMFEILLANWIVPCRLLSDNVGELMGLLVLIYRCVCGFAVLNVISAVFINQTMKIMSQDTDIMLIERGRAEKKYRLHLENLFTLLDMSHDGYVTRDEMATKLRDPEVHLACFKMGLSIHDLDDLIGLCDVGDAGMPIHQFIQVAHNIRKQANTLDVARVLVHVRKISEKMATIQQEVQEDFERRLMDEDNMVMMRECLDRMEKRLDVVHADQSALVRSHMRNTIRGTGRSGAIRNTSVQKEAAYRLGTPQTGAAGPRRPRSVQISADQPVQGNDP